jgi:hypothetical protein
MSSNTILALFGALGGLATFIAGVFVVVRAIFRQVGATEANTVALGEVKDALKDHETRLRTVERREGITP